MIDHDMERKIEELKAEIRNREVLSERELEAALRKAYREAGLPLRKDRYILEGDEVVAVDGPRWGAWFEHHFVDRMIARTVCMRPARYTWRRLKSARCSWGSITTGAAPARRFSSRRWSSAAC
jgi:hypothetical protein